MPLNLIHPMVPLSTAEDAPRKNGGTHDFMQLGQKMSKNKNMSKFAQFWWESNSWLHRNMSRSFGQNCEPRGVFLLFSHRTPSLSNFEFFLCILQIPSGKLIWFFVVPVVFCTLYWFTKINLFKWSIEKSSQHKTLSSL